MQGRLDTDKGEGKRISGGDPTFLFFFHREAPPTEDEGGRCAAAKKAAAVGPTCCRRVGKRHYLAQTRGEQLHRLGC